MQNAIQFYEFEEQPIRVLGTHDAPMFVAKDVCRVLGLGNPSQALADFEGDERGDIRTADTTGREQTVLAVTEPGLYRLIFASRKPEARAFRRWVCHEVLPAIRRTGG